MAESKKAVVEDTMTEEVIADKYDEYNYDQDKYEGGGSGKGRSKKESEQHTNFHDPCGHTRKTTQKLMNSHEKEKEHPHTGGEHHACDRRNAPEEQGDAKK